MGDVVSEPQRVMQNFRSAEETDCIRYTEPRAYLPSPCCSVISIILNNGWRHFSQYLSWQKPTLLQLSYPLLCIHSVFVFMALASSLSTRHPTESSEYRRCVEALLTVPGELEIQQYYEKVVLTSMPTVLYKQTNKTEQLCRCCSMKVLL